MGRLLSEWQTIFKRLMVRFQATPEQFRALPYNFRAIFEQFGRPRTMFERFPDGPLLPQKK
jgi:hypothetical protein